MSQLWKSHSQRQPASFPHVTAVADPEGLAKPAPLYAKLDSTDAEQDEWRSSICSAAIAAIAHRTAGTTVDVHALAANAALVAITLEVGYAVAAATPLATSFSGSL